MKRQAPHEMQQLQLQPEQPPQARQDLQPLAQPLQPEQPPQPRAYCTPGSRGSRFSRSKTKNVVKLTSMISSSLKAMFGPGAAPRTSAAGPTSPVADAVPASAIDTPTTPATGTAFFRCFCFFCRIVENLLSLERIVPAAVSYPCHGHLQDRFPTIAGVRKLGRRAREKQTWPILMAVSSGTS
jgi:hypothetical protein